MPAARLAAALGLAMASQAPAALAQSCHPLAGHWRYDAAASHVGSGLSFNPYYAVSGIDLVLEQGAGGLTQSWHLTGPHLDETDRYTTPADGTLAPTGTRSALNAVPQAVSGQWESCTLVEEGRASLFGQTVWTRSRFFVAADNRRLTITQSSHSDLGDVERTLIFTRTDERPLP
ncbi:MAG TPA: hypothetical protein VFF98_10805 [Novosphingobium sp.]|nr:hypothetical protein [Novosphingobium sp.]HZV08588.1 hypothetical protein [Novosphingobium sp.]